MTMNWKTPSPKLLISNPPRIFTAIVKLTLKFIRNPECKESRINKVTLKTYKESRINKTTLKNKVGGLI